MVMVQGLDVAPALLRACAHAHGFNLERRILEKMLFEVDSSGPKKKTPLP
jgi:hypothetical protein